MNILLLLPSDKLGGAEQYLLMITEKKIFRGDHVYVFCLKRNVSSAWHTIQQDNLKLFFTKYTKERTGIFSISKELIKNRNVKFDYAFTSHVHCSAFIGLLRKLKILQVDKHIARESTLVFKRFTGLKLFYLKSLYYIGYSNIDLLICQTDYMKEELKKALPWLDKKIKLRTILNPIDIQTIKKKSREKLVLSPTMFPYIVSAGRLIKEKGFDILIEAFSKILSVYPDLKLIILGEGKERRALENLIAELELQDKILLPGYMDNIYPYLKHAQLCVISSRIEGFPNTLLQMMASNTKVVSTLCAGGIEELEGVFTCVPDNIDDLAEAMKQCLASDTEINRRHFDEELETRSVSKFIRKIEDYLYIIP